MKLAIYGAQAMAFGAYKAIKKLFPDKEILCFIVTKKGMNASTLGDIPVVEFDDFLEKVPEDKRDEIEILIATPENAMQVIERVLEEAGIRNYVRLNSSRWSDMIGKAFLRSGRYLPLTAYVVGCNRSRLHVFKMVHFHDGNLKTTYQDPDYISTLQVGAENSPKMNTDFKDNKRVNISLKNGNYSELTGLYWIWKNILSIREDDDYYGLAHYRRLLNISDDDILRLKDNDIDVVLPYPMPYEPDMEAHRRRYLSEGEWAAVLNALRELCPEYEKAFEKILRQEYLYNYNIILARREVLDQYCTWLFPILFRVEEINDPDGIKTPNRFLGYVGESLETLYFMYHKYELKIAHAGIKFLI